MSLLLNYLKPHYTRIFLGFFSKFIATSIDLSIPLILAYIIDSIIPLGKLEGIFLWGGLMILLSFSSLKINIFSNKIASETASKATEKIRSDLFAKTLSLDTHLIDRFSLPSLVTRLTSDTYNIFNMITRMQKLGSRAPIQFLGGIIIMMSMDLGLSLIFISILPFIYFISLKITKKSIPLHYKSQIASDSLVRSLRENIQGIKVIKIFNTAEIEKKRFSSICKTILETEKKAVTMTALISPLVNLLINLGLIMIVLIGAWKINIGTTTPGTIIAFLTYFTMMLNTIMAVSRMFSLYSKGSASFGRIAEVLSMDTERNFKNFQNKKDTNLKPTQPLISFKNVSFTYPNSTKMALKNISFELNKNETLGIIGETGSGKSTIINLLLRLYSPDKGSIFLNGRNIEEIPENELYYYFGAALQNETIFSGMVKDNISFGRKVSADQISHVAEVALAKDFISEADNNFEYVIRPKGSNLSGGQKQRIGIARALANDPEILILDDAFSSLDYTTDYLLRQNLEINYKSTTKIIVSQRMSSIINADKVITLKDGEIQQNVI